MKQIVTIEEEQTKLRIKKLLKDRNTSIASIANNNSERVLFSRQISSEKSSVSYRLLHAILFAFDDVDANWLVMGTGCQSKVENLAPRVYQQHNEVHSNTAGGDINVGPDTIVTKKTVERLESKIEEQSKRISELETDKKNMQMLIDALTVKPRK